MTTWLFEFEFEINSVKDAVLVLQVRSSPKQKKLKT